MTLRSGRTRRWGRIVAASMLAPIVAFGSGASEAAGLTLVVDSTGDQADANPGDGACGTNVGTCTLRAAMQEADAFTGHDRIEFAIAGPGVDAAGLHRIVATSAFPTMRDMAGVTIDGYTQAGARVNTRSAGTDAVIKIELQGTGPSGIDGLEFRSTHNVIRGLAIFDFKRHIRLHGDNLDGAADARFNTIEGNFIGTNAAATFAAPTRVTAANGVHLEQGARSNLVGGAGIDARNLISGSADRGVAMFNHDTSFNLVVNNVIGLAPDGVSALANQGHGVDINFDASDNVVGGWNPGEGNVISANLLSGVEISHNASMAATERNQVVGNSIGTTADGSDGPPSTGNGEAGVNLEGNARCADSCPPDIARNIVSGNVIVGSPANVLIWKGAHDNRIVGNHIGLLADGSLPTGASRSGYSRWGVLIEAGAFSNVIESNVIGGVPRGVHIKPDNNFPDDCEPFDTTCPSDAAFPTSGNTITRNSIARIDAGLGIDLYLESTVLPGEYVSGPGAASPWANAGLGAPSINSADTDRLVVTGCVGCVLEVFETPTPACSNCWAEHGRGERFVFDVTLAAASETVPLRDEVSDPYVLGPGVQISATLTDPAGNTSEFSLRVPVSSGVIPPPPSATTTAAPTSPWLINRAGAGVAPAQRCQTSSLC